MNEPSMTFEQALRKVAGLLKLAEKAATPEEAATASAKASELMQRFQIERSVALDGAPEKDETIEDRGHREGEALEVLGERMSWWKWRLAQVVMSAHGCCGYMSTTCDNKALAAYRAALDESNWRELRASRKKFEKRTICIVGRASDVATVRYLYVYLREQIDQLTADLGRGQGKTWRNNFRIGAIETIGERFDSSKRQMLAEMRAKHGFVPTHELVLTHAAEDGEAPRVEVILVRKVDRALYREHEWGEPNKPAWYMFRDESKAFCYTDEDADITSNEIRSLVGVENPFALLRLETAIAKSEHKEDAVRDWMDGHMSLSSVRSGGGTYDGDGRASGRQAGECMSLGGGARGALGAGKKGLGSGK